MLGQHSRSSAGPELHHKPVRNTTTWLPGCVGGLLVCWNDDQHRSSTAAAAAVTQAFARLFSVGKVQRTHQDDDDVCSTHLDEQEEKTPDAKEAAGRGLGCQQVLNSQCAVGAEVRWGGAAASYVDDAARGLAGADKADSSKVQGGV